MGIFDLEDWRALWNLNKPPKPYRNQYAHSSLGTGLNRSNGDLSTNQRRYLARKNQVDEVDSRSHYSLDRQLSRSSGGKRAGSLPPPTTRRGSNQAPPRGHNVPNGMVEPISQPDGVRTILPVRGKNTSTPIEASTNSSESSKTNSPVRQNSTGAQRPVSKVKTSFPSNDSSWIKSRVDLDSSLEFVDNNNSGSSPATSQRYAAKEPVKNWVKQLNRKSTENLSNRYANPARSSPRDPSNSADDQPTTFNEAKLKFQQLAQAASARQNQSYNEPLRVKYNSQQNITGPNKTPLKQYQSAVGLDVYDYPNKNPEVQKRGSLYDRANSSGLPEPARFNTSQEVKAPRSAPLTTASKSHRSGRNIALLGLSSDNSEAETSEALVTSTPRSSTRITKSRGSQSDPNWDTLDITLKRSPKKSEGLGFVIRGGVGEEVRSGDPQIYVSQIFPGENAALDGRLRVGDIIVAVNGSDMRSISHKRAIHMLSAAGSTVRLTVKRFVGKVHIMLVTLLKDGQPLGLTITGGVGNEVPGGGTAIYVKNIIPGGVAQRTGGIEVGDQIQKVNNTPLVDASHHFATECLKNAGDPVALLIAKTGRINPLIFAE